MAINRTYLDFAVETAYQAGRLTLGYYQTDLRVDRKADTTPVTIADQLAESLIRQRIETTFPDHAILGEEHGEQGSTASTHRWMIDPIDGTKSFIRGVPLYAVLLGLEIEGVIEVGVAYFPALDEMIYAGTGSGCYWNGRRTRVSAVQHLSEAYISCTDPHSFELHNRGKAWQKFKESSYHRVGWTDAYGYALVATGRLELMLDPVMAPWDCGPFPVILREAGGYFGDWQGNETIYAGEGLGTTQTLLSEVLDLIQSCQV